MNRSIDLLVLPRVSNIKEILKGIALPVKVTEAKFKCVEFIFKNNSLQILCNGKDIAEYDSVWLSSFWKNRDIAYAVSKYLDLHNIPHSFVEQSTSKISDQVQFALEDLPLPDTYYSFTKNYLEKIDAIENTCSYPLVIKEVKGMMGKNSKLLQNRNELIEFLKKTDNHSKFMFQQFIPNDYDWGVMVVNGEVVSAEKSYGTVNDFRNNACNGATENFISINEIPSEIKEIAINASKSLSLNWSRADIIIDKLNNKPFLLEVNRAPGITSGSTEVKGAQKFLVEHLKGLSFL